MSKQVELLESGFYLIQSPCVEIPKFYVGPIKPTNSKKNGTFVSYDTQEGLSLGEPWGVYSRDELLIWLKDFLRKEPQKMSFKSENKTVYQDLFQGIKNLFKETDLQKAVLYRTFYSESSFIKLEEFLFLLEQGLTEAPGFLYSFYDPQKERAFLGRSPEYLFKSINGKIETLAVAGTLENLPENLWNDKLTQEQELVKKSIDARLGENVAWSKTTAKNFGSLKHLVSVGKIQEEKDLKDLSLKLHPTSAVGALPIEYSWKVKLGPKGRGFFGGYVEFSYDKEAFSLVTIRGFEWSSDRVQVCIGGGVLNVSNFEEEWSELELKWRSFQKTWRL